MDKYRSFLAAYGQIVDEQGSDLENPTCETAYDIVCGVESSTNTKGTYTCDADPTKGRLQSKECQACLAWRQVMRNKYKLRRLNTFRCDLFADPQRPDEDDAYCDSKDATQ